MCYILIVGNRVNSMNYFSKVHLSHLFQKLWAWRNSLTRAIPIISSSFELVFDRYCKIPNLTKSVDVVLLHFTQIVIIVLHVKILQEIVYLIIFLFGLRESLVVSTLSTLQDVVSLFYLIKYFW